MIPPNLEYVTTILVNLSLITALVCDCHLFSNINVSQGCAQMHMMCRGIFHKYFAAYLLKNLRDNFENWFRVNRVTAVSIFLPFWNMV